MNVLRLIVATEKKAKPIAHEISRQIAPEKEQYDSFWVEIVIEILLNRFRNLSQDEIMTLLDIGFDIRETQFYKDIAAEKEALGIAKGLIRLLQDRFGEIPEGMRQRIERLDAETLMGLYAKIWTLQHPEDLFES